VAGSAVFSRGSIAENIGAIRRSLGEAEAGTRMAPQVFWCENRVSSNPQPQDENDWITALLHHLYLYLPSRRTSRRAGESTRVRGAENRLS
jgi:hypothetical protein